jgi:hypothetical protein
VNVPKEKHNSAHFSNIGVYVNVQRFTLANRWREDGTAYLNMSVERERERKRQRER